MPTAVAVVLSLAGPAAAEGAYVVTSDQPVFAEAARAAAAALGGVATIRADDSAKATIASASVVVAIGPLAERVVGAALSDDARAIACLVPRAQSLPTARTLLVPLRADLTEVFSVLHAAVPGARTVGAFLAPSSDVDAARAAARVASLELVTPRAGDPFAAAVDRLVEETDVIFIEDAAAVPAGGAQLAVKRSSDVRKMVVGPNRATVLSGALMAVVPDPTAQGRAAGEAAARLLRGEAAAEVAAPAPRIVLNGALARALGVKLPAALASRAETVQ